MSLFLSNILSSKAQSKAADKIADQIKAAQELSDQRYNETVANVLDLYSPSFSELSNALNTSVDLFNQGRTNTAQLLQQGTQDINNLIAQGGNAQLSALLGIPQQQAQAQVQQDAVQAATQAAPQDGKALLGETTLPPRAETGELGGLRQSTAGEQIDPRLLNASQASTQAGINVAPSPDGLNLGASQVGMGPQQSTLPGTQAQPQPNVNLNPITFDNTGQAISVPQGANIGVRGAEDAIIGGALQGREDLAGSTASGIASLRNNLRDASNELRTGRDFALNQIGAGIDSSRAGFQQGRRDILGASQGALDAGQAGAAAAQAGAGQAVGFLSPYMQTGARVQGNLRALSGTEGQEAFDQALINDPAYRYAVEQQERALSRGSALTGSIGSGNVAAELQRQREGLAQSNVQNQFNRLFNLSEAGRGAASTAGGFTTQAGIASGNILNQAGQNAAGLRSQAGQLAAQQGVNEAGLRQAAGGVGLQSSQGLSQIAQQLGISENQAAQMLGVNLSNIATNTGQQVGGLRNIAGQQAANIIGQTTGAQAQNQAGALSNLANLDQQTLNNIVSAIQNNAQNQTGVRSNLASILANLSTGNTSQQVDLLQNLGGAQASGVTNPVGNTLDQLIGLLAGSGTLGG